MSCAVASLGAVKLRSEGATTASVLGVSVADAVSVRLRARASDEVVL